MTEEQQIKWCVQQHIDTNHKYDGYLPYEFHLRMVDAVRQEFVELIPNRWSEMQVACYGHDLIEDCRVTYNDCRHNLGEYVAEIIYAVSNEKGKNRKQRANDKYYAGIIATPGALFVKMCDRIANVRYSKMTNSRMLQMYKEENEAFMDRIYDPALAKMFVHLSDLLK